MSGEKWLGDYIAIDYAEPNVKDYSAVTLIIKEYPEIKVIETKIFNSGNPSLDYSALFYIDPDNSANFPIDIEAGLV